MDDTIETNKCTSDWQVKVGVLFFLSKLVMIVGVRLHLGRKFRSLLPPHHMVPLLFIV